MIKISTLIVDQQIVQMLNDGKTLKQIARELHVTYWRANYAIRRLRTIENRSFEELRIKIPKISNP